LQGVNRGKQQLKLSDLLLVGQKRRKLIAREIKPARNRRGCHQ
jgi:hypothetical protein